MKGCDPSGCDPGVLSQAKHRARGMVQHNVADAASCGLSVWSVTHGCVTELPVVSIGRKVEAKLWRRCALCQCEPGGCIGHVKW